jgi:predicted transcriptional regulator
MDTQCETLGKYILPVFRALVAKELVSTHHLTQSDAAKSIGTTQAAISQYVTSKRSIKCSEQFAPILPKIQVLAVVAARKGQKTPEGYYNLERMLRDLVASGATVLACGTCLNSRALTKEDLIEGIEVGTMLKLAGWIKESS